MKLEWWCEERGGKVADTVSSRVDYVVVGRKPGEQVSCGSRKRDKSPHRGRILSTAGNLKREVVK